MERNTFYWTFWKRPTHCRTTKQGVKVVQCDVCEHLPNLTGCHSNVPWATGQPPNEYRYIHSHQYAYQTCKVRQDRFRIFWDIWRDMPIFAVSPQKGVIVNSVNSGDSGPNVTKIVHNVEQFIMVHHSKSELRYCNPFPNGSATK